MIALYIAGMVLGLAGIALIIWGCEHMAPPEDEGRVSPGWVRSDRD